MIWMRPRGEAGISPLACPDFNGNTIAELKHIRDEHERDDLLLRKEHLEYLLAKTNDDHARAELQEQIATIEASLKA